MILPRRKLLKVSVGLLAAIGAPAIVRAQIFNPPMFMPQPVSVATTTFDPAHTNANITLSNGNLTATDASAGHVNTRTIASHSSGKFYCEFLAVVSPGGERTSFGVLNGSQVTSSYLGSSANSISNFDDGAVYYNGSTSNTIAGFTAGDIVCMAVDIGNNNIWWRTNGGNWNNNATNNPATNTGGISMSLVTSGAIFAGVSLNSTPSITANFGGSAYSFTLPSGFGNW